MHYDLAQLMKKALSQNKDIIKKASIHDLNPEELSPQAFEEIYEEPLVDYLEKYLNALKGKMDVRVAYAIKMLIRDVKNSGASVTDSEPQMTKGDAVKKRLESVFGSPISVESIVKTLEHIVKKAEEKRSRDLWDYPNAQLDGYISDQAGYVFSALPIQMHSVYSDYLQDKVEDADDTYEIMEVANKIANGFGKEHYEFEYRSDRFDSELYNDISQERRTGGIPQEEQIRILSVGLLNI